MQDVPLLDETETDVAAPENGGEFAAERNIGSDVARDGDASIATDGDAGEADVRSEDVATEPPPPPDGSCNSPYTCAPPVPSGWSGPALLWTSTSTELPPDCPMNYSSLDLGAGLTGGSADTCSCNCAVSNEACTTIMTFYPDSLCASPCLVPGGGTGMIRVTPASDGTCTQVPANLCGSNGTASTTMPSYSADCVAQTMTTPGSAPAWTTAARICSWTPNAGTQCDGGDAGCIVGPTTGFAATACIFKLGDMQVCPAAYPKSSGVFSQMTDTRGCSPCMCSGPSGGSCSGQISTYGDTACGILAWTDFSLGSCQSHLAIVPNPGSVNSVYAITSGTCSVASSPQSQGGVTATGATTVCCL
jgi:hypothetical protein